MAKLYFKFGAMGCSKTAQALITKFNYEERGMKVMLMKPAVDNRDGESITRSRIGLSAPTLAVSQTEDLYALYKKNYSSCNVIIVDECQFLTPEQVDQLGQIVIDFNIPVLCFGLATDFTTHMCGAKATVNARMDDHGNIVFKGEQVCLGGNDRYVAMCRKCWLKKKAEQEAKGLYL